MKRFQFKLDPALRLRSQAEEQAQVELAEKLRLAGMEERRLEELRQELRTHRSYRAGLQRGAFDPTVLLQADRYGDALEAAAVTQQARVTQAAAAVEASREALRQRRMEREALERLRERRLEEYRREALRVEQQGLDETAVLRWRDA
jgi:flagellar FliJ protein